MAKEDQALIVIESLDLQTVFTPTGIDSVINHIEQQVASFVPDMTTAGGRKEIASMAYRVTRSKTLIDKAGQTLTEDWKKKAKKVDTVRRKAWDKLEEIQARVRAPLTEWEEIEKTRIANHQANMKTIKELGEMKPDNLEDLVSVMFKLDSFNIDTSWQEFMAAGIEAQNTARNLLVTHRQLLEQRIEIERLRKEADKKAQEDRDRKLAEDAAAKAKKDAEDVIAKAKKDAEDAIAKAKRDAENKARYDKEQADLRVKQAEENAKKAADAERQRILKEQRDADMAQKKREADLEHKKRINQGAMQAIKSTIGCTDDHAKNLVIAIAKGQIPNVTIKY